MLIDKPAGITSFGIVARVRGIIRNATGQKVKIGHTGTLDPAATGLMIIVIGKYTKRAGEFSKLDKTYEAEVALGSVSTTADREGEISQISTRVPTSAEIGEVLNKFIGEIMQTPHAFSAIKVDGQRAYKLARAGKPPELKPRQVTIYELQSTNYQYPKLCIATRVSSGTYIRSLAEDIGAELGVGAYISQLRRTKVGNFSINHAHKIESLNPNNIASLIDKQG